MQITTESPSPESRVPLDRYAFYAVFALAAALSVFQLFQGFTTAIPSTYLRPVHLSWVMVLIFMQFPLVRNEESPLYLPSRLMDLFFSIVCVWGGWNITSFDYRAIDHILYGLADLDYFTGLAYLLLAVEAARRAIGWPMAVIGLTFLAYNAFGNMLPDALANRGFSFERIVKFQVYSAEGLFGAPLGIAAGAVFMFVLFGAFLESTGCGKFFIDISYAIAGKYRGGPAKACVVASGAMGSISGSAIANAATIGALTIPMMKKLGYKPEQAAGIEAAASTGGQIMPPVMGAGAFIMAEYTDTPYSHIVLISFAPAVLYYTCTLLYVHLMACKLGIEGMQDRPRIWQIIKDGSHFIIPLLLITVLLLLKFSPILVGAIGAVAVVIASLVRTHTRVNPMAVIRSLKAGAMMAAPVSAACAVAGVIVGVIGQTGIGLEFTSFVLSLADGRLWIALALVAFAAFILGMGLPVTAAYIIVAVVAAPALSEMGLNLLVAHMLIFWLSQTSNVTPPVALAAFAAAGVAGSNPMKSATQSVKLAIGFFVIPLMMAYSDLLYTGDVTILGNAWAIAMTLSFILTIAFAVEGYAVIRTDTIERAMFALAIPGFLFQHPLIDAAGMTLFLLALLKNFLRHAKERSKAVSTG